MKNEIINMGGTDWKVVQARSKEDAINAINHSIVRGSVGSAHYETTQEGSEYVSALVADVVKLNPDGTEVKAYGEAY